MKNNIDLSKTLAQLRQLPPEVSFAQVERWVNNPTIPPIKTNHWLSSWLARWRSLN